MENRALAFDHLKIGIGRIHNHTFHRTTSVIDANRVQRNASSTDQNTNLAGGQKFGMKTPTLCLSPDLNARRHFADCHVRTNH